jgi:hypothetical protein
MNQQLPIYEESEMSITAAQVSDLIAKTVALTSDEQNALLIDKSIGVLTHAMEAFFNGLMGLYTIYPDDCDTVREFLYEAVLYTAKKYTDGQMHNPNHASFVVYYSWFAVQILESYRRGGIEQAREWHDTAMGNYFESKNETFVRPVGKEE